MAMANPARPVEPRHAWLLSAQTAQPRMAWLYAQGQPSNGRLYAIPIPGIAVIASGSNPASSAKCRPRAT